MLRHYPEISQIVMSSLISLISKRVSDLLEDVVISVLEKRVADNRDRVPLEGDTGIVDKFQDQIRQSE